LPLTGGFPLERTSICPFLGPCVITLLASNFLTRDTKLQQDMPAQESLISETQMAIANIQLTNAKIETMRPS
jgi:hypothetical protein